MLSSEEIQALPEVPPGKTGRWKDFTGVQVGAWKIVCYVGDSKWKCLCTDCGRFYLRISFLIHASEHQQCKDCWLRKTHGKHWHTRSKTPSKTYYAWRSMLKRCNNPTEKCFPSYGGRGITVCKRWLEFSKFLEDMGEAPAGLSLERKDNNGHYEPGNCVWATPMEQGNNRRTNRFVIVDGEKLTVSQAERRTGYAQGALIVKLQRAGIPKEQTPTLIRASESSGKLRWALC